MRWMWPLAALCWAVCTGSAYAAAGTVLYVAPNGNDRWTGARAAPNRGRTDGPLATLEGARNRLRALRRAGRLRGPATVMVRGGRYLLRSTLVFGPEDSGTPGAPVVFRAFPGERPELAGGRPVRGWKRTAQGVFVTSLPAQGIRPFRFHQLFFRGERQVLARHPNYDPAHPRTGGFLYVDAPAQPTRRAFHYAPGEIPFQRWKHTAQAEVNLFPYNCWDHNIIPIAEVDPQARRVLLRYPVAGTINEANRYFIQNVLDALDAPGEWYVDYATGTLYFRPPGGKVADGDVFVPVVENLVEISGADSQPVRYLHLRGFRLSCAEQDAITLEGAEECRVVGNIVTNVGGVGINAGYLRNALKGIGNRWVKGGRVRTRIQSGDRALLCSHHCRSCRVAGNDVSDCGGDGIVLIGEGNQADNNHVYRTGHYDQVSAGITLYGTANVASHNEIHDVPRDAIFINGARNIAEYNAIRNTMLNTADNAAIALRQHDVAQAVRDRGNVIRFNRILDTVGYGSYPHCTYPPKGYASPFCSWGIYLDGSISGVTVYGNVIARSGANSLFIQFGGGNIVENNIFVETMEEAVQFDCMLFFGWLLHPDTEGRFHEPPNQIRRNIFYYTGKAKKLYSAGLWGHPEWNEAQAVFDQNLIWHQGLPVEVELDPKRTYRSFAEWQAAGHDQRSLVADPRFVNPAQDDYRLRPDSPAFQVGFRNINAELAKVGAYPSPERATWPLTNRSLRRERPVVFTYRKPPRPIVDGFELAPAGSVPERAQAITEGAASVAVTGETAATGRQCLKLTDAPGLAHDYNPHVVYPLNYPPGRLHFSVDVMNPTEAPAAWYLEFRDWRQQPLVGPTLSGRPDGRLSVGGRFGAGGTEIAMVPNGTWFTLTIDFETGKAAPRSYTLTLKVPGRPAQTFPNLPFVDPEFEEATWFGISSLSTDRAALYVDNLVLGPATAAEVRAAATAPAIRGIARKPAQPPQIRNADRLLLYWKCDEPGGFRLVDASGNQLHGDTGDLPRARGSFGRALYLDGSSAAEVEDSPLLHFGTDSFTVECWVCPTQLGIESEHPRRRLLDKGLWPATWWNVDVWSDGRVQMEMGDGTGQTATTQSAGGLREREWTHLAIVVDRQRGQTRYYLNGRLDSAPSFPGPFTARLDLAGRSLTTGTWQPFTGLLDELRIYGRALSEAEVQQHYRALAARYRSARFTIEAE